MLCSTELQTLQEENGIRRIQIDAEAGPKDGLGLLVGVAFATGQEKKRWSKIDHVDFSLISEAEGDHSSVTN